MLQGRFKINEFSFVVIFAALYPILPNYFSVGGIYIRNLLAIAIFFLFGLKIKIPKEKNNLYVYVLIWIGGISCIQILHLDVKYALQQLIIWFLCLPVLISTITTKKRFLKIIDVIICASTVVGIFGIIEETTHFNIFSLINLADYTLNYNAPRMGLLRIISFTSHAISYCVYCMFVLAIIFYRLTLKGTKHKLFYVFSYFLICLNAFFTLSRSALLCIIASQLILLWKCGRKRFIKRIFLLLFGASILIAGASVVNKDIANAVQIAIYIIFALFNDNAADYLISIGFTNNANGIGQRFDLYQWVWQAVKGNLLIGMGRTAAFAHNYVTAAGNRLTKESIEIEWLRTLYRYGILGLLSESIFFIKFLISSFKAQKSKMKNTWEGNLSFASMSFTVILLYIVVLFAVMQNEDAQMLYIMLILFTAYVKHDGYGEFT